MVGLRLLARLNEVLTLGKRAPPEVPFGGINVILLGDYIQYMPILDRPLYTNLERGSSTRLPTEADVQYGVGRSLVLQINTVTKLTQQMRTEDQKYLTLLNNIRLGETTRADFDYLCTRIIGRGQIVQSLKDKPWCDAPILVFRNQLRTEINNRAALDRAKEAGVALVVVVANDKIRSKSLQDDAIYERLLHLPDNKTELLPGLLPLVPNMPVLLTDNIACELGLSNGTQGIFRELIYDGQENLDGLMVKSDVFPSDTIYIRKPLYALVEINTSQLETTLDGLRPKLIPIPLIKKQFTVPTKQLFGRLFESAQSGKIVPQVIQVTRTQLPIVPAFAITTYKAQGLTMNKIVVDLRVPLRTLQVASVYVPLSRVKKAEDVVILRPFDMKALQVRPSPTQDAELKRLDELDRKTRREYTSFTF
ncbi:unnamed protein product [Rotaria sp. Silwood2]|nr:unnamed protein product [Rotaria sp. Silwood2]CAF3090615.1 unnamed protein product [Rotaria sp. Silwood2]CAF3309879.1 unnamed protein product [Rotaria sp. Silwood2]CAF3407251.1 unnamed protein product [Rotaria sp. Silwood2]CAF4030079.1 unnamed protein product [Rotaria sp. Silwood2]